MAYCQIAFIFIYFISSLLIPNISSQTITLKNGDLRLNQTNGAIRNNSGLLQIYNSGNWEFLCSNWHRGYTNVIEANEQVACREMGFNGHLSVNYNQQIPSQNYSYFSSIDCVGNEAKLTDCSNSGLVEYTGYCNYAILLECKIGGCDSRIPDNTSYPVEVYLEDSWYYINYTSMTPDLANTLCMSQYGKPNLRISSILLTDEIAVRNRKVYSGSFNCSRSNSFFCACTRNAVQISELNFPLEVANVECQLDDFDIRLTYNKNSGFIQIYNHSNWVTVCSNWAPNDPHNGNGFSNSNDASYSYDIYSGSLNQLVCISLGYKAARVYYYTNYYLYFDDYYNFFYKSRNFGSIPYGINYISCNTNNTVIDECNIGIYSSCSSSTEVYCYAGKCEVSVQDNSPVEIYLEDGWRIIDYDDINNLTAKIICLESAGIDFYSIEAYNITNSKQLTYTPFAEYTFQCSGTEYSLCDCHKEKKSNTANTQMAAIIRCNRPANGAVRQLSDTLVGVGPVQMYLDDFRWQYICDDSFSISNGRVLCRELGYNDVISVNTETLSESYRNRFSISKYISHCEGNETSLSQCETITFDICSGHTFVNLTCSTDTCDVLTSDNNDAPALIYNNSEWYYTCAAGFNTTTVNLLCETSGKKGGSGFVKMSRPENSTHHVYTYSLNCPINANSICECSTTANICTDMDEVIIPICTLPESGELRLIDSETVTSEGIVQVYYNGSWGLLCDLNKNSTHLTAYVACRQLGYKGAVNYGGGFYSSTPHYNNYLFSYFHYFYSNFYRRNSYSPLTNLHCYGNESKLNECSYSESSSINCHERNLFWVKCDEFGTGDVRLYGSNDTNNTDYEGYLQVYSDKEWHYLCGDVFNGIAADVVCRDLFATRHQEYRLRNVSLNNDNVLQVQVSCLGTEVGLHDCRQVTYHKSCSDNSTAVYLKCRQPSIGSIRLSSGHDLSGVLEMYYNEEWHPLCATEYPIELICNELGFTGDDYHILDTTNLNVGYWSGTVSCNSNDSKLYDCLVNSSLQYVQSCSNRAIKPSCQLYTNIRLSRGNKSSNGVLQLLNSDSDWYDVCYYAYLTYSYSYSYYYFSYSYDSNNYDSNDNSYYNDHENQFNYHPRHEAWPILNSELACRKLGYLNYTNATIIRQPIYYEYAEVLCSNSTNEFNDCEFKYIKNIINRDYIKCDGSVYLECENQILPTYSPQNITGVAISSTSIQIWWSAVEAETDIDITRYKIFYTGTEADIVTHTIELQEKYLSVPYKYTLTTLEEADSYKIKVSAGNQHGFGPYTQIVNVETLEDRPTGLLMISISSITSNSFTVYWLKLPLKTSNGVITQYLISVMLINMEFPPNNTTPIEIMATGEATSATITGLQASSNYSVSITPYTAVGRGVVSEYPLIIATIFEVKITTTTTPPLTTTSTPTTPITTTPTTPITTTTTTPITTTTTTTTTSTTTTTTTPSTTPTAQLITSEEIEKIINSTAEIPPVVATTYVQAIEQEQTFSSTTEEYNNYIAVVATIVNNTNNLMDATFIDEFVPIVVRFIGNAVNGLSNITEEKDSNSAAEVVNSFDSISNALTISDTISLAVLESNALDISNSSITIINDKIYFKAAVIIPSQDEDVVTLLDNTDSEGDVSESVAIPNTLIPDTGTKIAVTVVKINTRNEEHPIASNIISIVATDLPISMFDQPIILQFSRDEKKEGQAKCYSLNTITNTWITDGIETIIVSLTDITCKSYHLTSFAVLVTPYPPTGSNSARLALSIVSYILLTGSLIGLIASIVLYCIAYKTFFKIEVNIIYFNLALCLLLAIGLFVTGVQVGTRNFYLCHVIGFSLQYIWTAVFVWKLCTAVYIFYKLFIGVFSNHKICWYLIIAGWTTPILLPIITIAIARDYYVDVTRHCWLSYERGLIWSFLAPIIVILIINTLLLIVCAVRIWSTRRKTEEMASSLRSTFISVLILSPVLGLPWLILILNIFSTDTLPVEWIFNILLCPVGLVFFFVITLRNKEVQSLFIKKKFNEVSSNIDSTSTLRSDKYAKKKTAPGPMSTEMSYLAFSASLTASSNNEECFRNPVYEEITKEKNMSKPSTNIGVENLGYSESIIVQDANTNIIHVNNPVYGTADESFSDITTNKM